MRDIVFDLDKNLTLRKENILSFPSLNRFFALSFDRDTVTGECPNLRRSVASSRLMRVELQGKHNHIG